MNYEKLGELLFPNIEKTPEYYEKLYPPRDLPEGARATRFAPSPTGYLHIGGLFGALTDLLAARVSGGVVYLRIEDTDKKREIDEGAPAIIEGLKRFGIEFDEGPTGLKSEKGRYGPYLQSERTEIYRTVAKSLVKKGLAYPCFCSAERLSEIRAEQEKSGAVVRGYFGEWATCRSLTLEQIEKRVSGGEPWTLRLRSRGKEGGKIVFDDAIRGKIEAPENVIDEVLLKSNGVPTYHFAHVCDDHFMRTTHVIRGEEWISSVPKHLEIFKACGYRVPKYAHTPQVLKIDEETGDKRKLSKRKDPEASISYFIENGFPKESVVEYLLTLINSNFEDWRRANPREDFLKFPFGFKKMSASGCLFDLAKLNDASKNVISRMSADDVYERVAEWAGKYDPEFFAVFTGSPEISRAAANIDREKAKPRKDLAKWSEVKDYFSYLYKPLYKADYSSTGSVSFADAAAIAEKYAGVFSARDGGDVWFDKIKGLCAPLGFSASVKEYKKNPDKYKGSVADVSTAIRVALTSRAESPDLYAITAILGEKEVKARLLEAAEYFREKDADDGKDE